MKKMVVLFVGALALFAVQAEPAAKTNGDSPSAAAKTVLESRIAEVVQQANAQLQNSAPEAGLELGWQNYQRGLFSSHLQLVVKPAAGKESSWLAAGQPLVFDEVVSHGPFPLAAPAEPAVDTRNPQATAARGPARSRG